jgi:acyl-CoA oxidase
VVAAASEPRLKELLTKLVRLYCLHHVKENLGWYLMNGVISAPAAKDLEVEYQKAVKSLVPHLNEIMEAYNLPKVPQLGAPIARDYVQFNAQEDPENVNAAGDYFDFRNGPKL